MDVFLFRIDQCFVESRAQVESISRSTVKRLLLELETGGNVRFEDGTTNDIWYVINHIFSTCSINHIINQLIKQASNQ